MLLGYSVADLAWLTLGELNAMAGPSDDAKGPSKAFVPDLDYALTL